MRHTDRWTMLRSPLAYVRRRGRPAGYMLGVVLLTGMVGIASAGSGAVRASAIGGPTPAHPAVIHAAAPPIVVDRQALGAFFHALIPAQLDQRHIPGAVVAVVQDDQLAFAQGYGWADLERRIPVDADRTLFHIGSNGKLFTWTAVMQLVEQGKLDLDADINTYLDFRIPATYPQPITLAHLMTHTAGFENRDLGWLAPSPEEVMPLGDWLAANLPARVRPPGIEAGYSNYGTALAGYIVERVTEIPYTDYIEQKLLVPLGMERSTARQHVPAALASGVAAGYVFEDGRFHEEPLVTYQGTPAGPIRATAPDVARFMLAHLADGRAGTGRILGEGTARQMRQPLFRAHPRLHGMAYGFLEMDRNGERIVGHIGSAAPVHYSVLALLPDRSIGLFVAFNADTARPLTVGNETLTAFVDRFFPAPVAAPITPPADFAARAEQYTGEYQRNNFGGSYTTVERLGRLLNATTNRRVTDPGDGTLEVTSGLFGSARFVEVEPDLFRRVDGQELLLFRRDAHGRVAQAVLDGEPEHTFERLGLTDSAPFYLGLLGACVVLFASALLAPAGRFLLGRRRTRGAARSRTDHTARLVGGLAAALNLAFLVGLVLVLGDPGLLMGEYARLRAWLILPLITTGLAGGMLIFTLLAWQRRRWSLPARLHYTAVSFGALAFTWFLAHWNLLGFRF